MKATELVFILDKSGSMAGLGKRHHRRVQFHAEKAEGSSGECRITTVSLLTTGTSSCMTVSIFGRSVP